MKKYQILGVIVGGLALVLVSAGITYVAIKLPSGSDGSTEVTETSEVSQEDSTQPDFGEDLALVDEVDLINHAESLEIVDNSSLSDKEIEDLQFMREEEKLAHDVYTKLYEKWGQRIFTNISDSEQQHTDSIKTLLVAYDLDDPVINEVGKFSNSDLQKLYTQLVSDGSESIETALEVGALVEDLDIVDLEEAMSNTDDSAILTVYENLQRGSRNHLRSFTSSLSRYGVAYEPQNLSESEYLEILAGAHEGGSGTTQGNGNGNN